MEEPPKFVADRMLSRLARWLRLLGADVAAGEAIGGPLILRVARAERRIALTRDKRLRTAPEVLYIRSNGLREQIREVLARCPFDTRRLQFTRCSRCNEPLEEAARESVARRVPPFVFASQPHFFRCRACGRIYWNATHLERARRELRSFGL